MPTHSAIYRVRTDVRFIKELESSCSVEENWNVESWRNYRGTRERRVFRVSGGGRYGRVLKRKSRNGNYFATTV